MKVLAAICLAQALALCLAQAPAPSPGARPTQAQLDQAVTEAVNSRITLAQEQIPLVQALQAAIDGGNLTAAQAAYAPSRVPYEQIEIIAYGFPDIDSDLDARPIDVSGAEANLTAPSEAESGTVYLGWHRIEGLIFRDQNLSAAAPYAARLVNSSQELLAALRNRSNFNVAGTWGGLTDEGVEIGGKKISSEEETFSDLSVLILYNNFLGIQEVYLPFADLLQAANPVTADRVNDAFAAAFASVAPYTPLLDNGIAYTPYSYVTPQQRAPIQRAAYGLASVLRQAAADLGIELEAEEEDEECVPTIEVAAIPASSNQIQQGLDYFRALLPAQEALAANLTAAIQDRDLDAAKAAYLRLRPIYEQIEVLANSYLDIDSDIDAREYAFPYGEQDPGFKGGHHIEALLYRDGDVGPRTLAFAQGYQDSFRQLDAVFADSGSNDSIFNPNNNFGGIIGLANEIVAKKISSEEEKYSEHSWLIFYNNYKGLYSQALPFYGEGTADLRTQLQEAVQDVIACMPVETQDEILDLDVSGNSELFVENLSSADYKLYSQATRAEKECLTTNGYRVRQSLIEAAAMLNLLDDCSDFANEIAAARETMGMAPAPAVATSSIADST